MYKKYYLLPHRSNNKFNAVWSKLDCMNHFINLWLVIKNEIRCTPWLVCLVEAVHNAW